MYRPYSHSRLATYLQCPRKFKFHYIEKLKGKATDDTPLKKGELTHFLIESKIKGNTPDMKQIEEKYKPEIVSSAKDIVDNKFLNMDFVKKLKEKYNIVACESKFGLDENFSPCGYWDKKALIRGALDLTAVSKSDTQKQYIIVDWKTGKVKQSVDSKLDQLGLYSIVLYETDKIDSCYGVYAYVEHNEVKHNFYDEATRVTQKKELLRLIDVLNKDKSFKKNTTPLCNWCQFQEICEKGTSNGDC